MKEIKALIQPPKLDDVLGALHKIEGVGNVVSSEVRCSNAVRGNLHPNINVRIEVFIPDDLVEVVLAAIQKHARTGRAGDGRIFVTDVEHTVLIRSGEHDVS